MDNNRSLFQKLAPIFLEVERAIRDHEDERRVIPAFDEAV